MRQVGDTLVWLMVVAVVAAVLYLAPRVAHYVSSSEREIHHEGGSVAWRVVSEPVDNYVDSDIP